MIAYFDLFEAIAPRASRSRRLRRAVIARQYLKLMARAHRYQRPIPPRLKMPPAPPSPPPAPPPNPALERGRRRLDLRDAIDRLIGHPAQPSTDVASNAATFRPLRLGSGWRPPGTVIVIARRRP